MLDTLSRGWIFGLVFVSLTSAVAAQSSKPEVPPARQNLVPVNPAITPNDPLPTRVFDCGGSVISLVGGRLEGLPNSGSTAVFTNGGRSVSYDVVDAIRRSRVGDHVMMCLVYIPDPQKCPPGDTRGRVYTVTNLRTLESWTLSPDQHKCGGA
jgi:hypothetical protein